MAGENNNQPVRSYQKQFKELLRAVYQKQAYFSEFFGGSLQALDGVENNKTAFSLKTSDIPMVIKKGTLDSEANRAYKTGANVAFGTGTGNSTRFGPRTEIIYNDTDVNYTWDWVIHEGIDQHTVNTNFDSAVADRLDLQAQEKVQLFDNQGGAFISDVAGKTFEFATVTNDTILKLFNDLSTYYVNIEAVGQKLAYVRPEIYNAIVDHPLTTSAKSSAANIDANGILNFKGFRIKEVPDAKFKTGELALTTITGVGRQFTGINTARTINSEDFDGVALQGAGKAGEFILPANKAAVTKVVVPETPEG